MEAKAVIGKEAAITGLARIEGRVVIFVVWNYVHSPPPTAFRRDHRMVFFSVLIHHGL